jgi:hypothetical protein
MVFSLPSFDRQGKASTTIATKVQQGTYNNPDLCLRSWFRRCGKSVLIMTLQAQRSLGSNVDHKAPSKTRCIAPSSQKGRELCLKIACWDYIPVWEIRLWCRFGLEQKWGLKSRLIVVLETCINVRRTYIGICVCMSYRRTWYDIK